MKQNNKYKTIGILGGMGPEGTVDMYEKIFKYFQDTYNAKYDRDFPPIVIYSVPIPDVVESLENEKQTLEMLSNAAKKLASCGCDFIVIACNTVQFLLDKIRLSVNIPIIGIAEVNVQKIKDNGLKKVGILATETTINKGVYSKEFQKIGIKLVVPSNEDQNTVTEVIMSQLSGKKSGSLTRTLVRVINNLKKAGAEAVLIACTDLPLLIKQKNCQLPLIDCTEIYANEAAKIASVSNVSNSLVSREES